MVLCLRHTYIYQEGNDVSLDFSLIDESAVLTALDITNTNAQSLDGIEALNKLIELHASSNNLQGDFPRNVLQLNLTLLDISFNKFGGSLPNDFGFGLRSLKQLSLGHNSFSGTIPSSIGCVFRSLSSIEFWCFAQTPLNVSFSFMLSQPDVFFAIHRHARQCSHWRNTKRNIGIVQPSEY
jgi:Leucine-rich repeat (LRR) protein